MDKRKKLFFIGIGISVILILVVGGFVLGKALKPSKPLTQADNLYLANKVTLTARGPQSNGQPVFIKLRYKPTNSTKWTETTTKSAITTEEKATYQTFDVNNLKKATTYEYQTQNMDSSGKAGNWSGTTSFATARILGTSENNSAVAFAKANNTENPGDTTFEGKAENADYYLWDFGDGQKSEYLVDSANTNHIYSVGGEVTATMTAYKYVSEADSFFNKQTQYSGRAIVAQKEVKFFVNLPVPITEYTEDGGIKTSLDKVSSLPQPPVALANQNQAVLGNRDTPCSPAKLVTFEAKKQRNIEVKKVTFLGTAIVDYNLEEKYDGPGFTYGPTNKTLSRSLVAADCRISWKVVYDNHKGQKEKFYIECQKEAVGTVGYYWKKDGSQTKCNEGTINIKVGDGGKDCKNSVWVLEGEECKFITNSCLPKNNNCPCGIKKVIATQDDSDPLTYSFKVVLPEDPKSKIIKIDFGDGTSQEIEIPVNGDLDVLDGIVHQYTVAGVQNILVNSYYQKPTEGQTLADQVACGSYTLALNLQRCSVGQRRTFTADKYNGDIVQSPSGVVVRFIEPTLAVGAERADKYKIKYGDNIEEVVDPSTSTGDEIKYIATHTYVSRGSYLPTIEGLKVGSGGASDSVSCGSPISLNRQIIITGPNSGTDGTCSLGTDKLTADPPRGKAEPTKPLEIKFTAKIEKSGNTPLGTEYQVVWGDAAGASESQIVKDQAKKDELTFTHKYRGPNLKEGTGGKYTAILQAFRVVDGARVSCGSVSTIVTITNIPDVVGAETCGFSGKFTAKPIKVDVSKNKTVKFKSDVSVLKDKKIKQPNFWRYSFGDGDTKPIPNTTAKQLNERDDITKDYDTNGIYNVVLRGYYYGDSSVECDAVGIDQPIEVVNGKKSPQEPGLCSMGDAQLTPAPVANATAPLKKTVTITGMNNINSIVIDWGGDETPTTLDNLKDKTRTTASHTYNSNATYTVKVTSYKNNLAVNCGTKEFEDFTIGPSSPTALTGASITRAGEVLTATTTPAEATATFQWKKRDTSTEEFTGDTTGNTFTLTSTDVGKYFKVIATGTGVYAGSVVTSNPFGPITTIPDPPPSVPIVTIGTQTWMQNNMNVGTRIDGGTTQTGLTKWCYDNLESNCTTYGGLYQWNTAMQYVTTQGAQGICPAGFHIPTDAEYTTLTTYLGGEPVAGDKMKSASLCQGRTPCGASGFNALLGGYYDRNSWRNLGSNGYFWSSLEPQEFYAWDRYLHLTTAQVGRQGSEKTYGHSVRCLKN